MSGLGRLAVIGGGRMGEAIVGGLLAADAVQAGSVVVAEPNATRRAELAGEYGVAVVEDGAQAVVGADTVLLAVKPQIVDGVVTALAGAIVPGTLVVSIAAGITCARLESLLPADTPVVRVMPNTPALVGRGHGGRQRRERRPRPSRSRPSGSLFAAIGEAVVLDERYQNAATAISGSGPAYVAVFVDALARAGVREGLSRDVAQRLAVQTVRGTAELIERTGQHPEAIVDAVASPGGTTIAAIAQLEAGGFRASIAAAVRAAVERSRELGS